MTDGLPQPQRLFAFLTVAIATVMAVLDTAIANIALPTISQALQTTPSQAIWVVNAYQLAVTVSLLPLASLGDILGYKRVYWVGLAVFTLASAVCAAAHSLLFLSCARVVQGLGAAGIMSVNIALVRFIYPKARLGVAVGYYSLVVAAASAAGPSIAALILSVAHWQWLFLVNLPLGVLALCVGARALPVTPASGNRFDVTGAILNALALGLLISGLATFSEHGALRSALAMVGGGLAVGAIFIWRELGLPAPMLPVDLLRMPVFSLSLATSMCSFAAQTMALIALPFYFEQALGHSETHTGLLMTPWPLMTALIAPLAGRLSDRYAAQKLASLGLVLLAAGLALLGRLDAAPSTLDIGWRLAICGLGFGLFQSPNNRVIMSSAPKARSGGASGLQSLGRLLGQSLGAVILALLFGHLRGQHIVLITALAAGLALFAAGCSLLRGQAASA